MSLARKFLLFSSPLEFLPAEAMVTLPTRPVDRLPVQHHRIYLITDKKREKLQTKKLKHV